MIKRANFAELHNDLDAAPLMTIAEIKAIRTLIIKNIDTIKVIVEIGCYAGGTTIRMAQVAGGDAKIYAIDNFTVDRSVVRDLAIKNFKKYPNIELWEETSQHAAHRFNEVIDLLFIDGDHQDDSILKDCLFWLPKIRVGGFVIFDDYNNDEFPAVRRRAIEQMINWNEVMAIDTIAIFQRPS